MKRVTVAMLRFVAFSDGVACVETLQVESGEARHVHLTVGDILELKGNVMEYGDVEESAKAAAVAIENAARRPA